MDHDPRQHGHEPYAVLEVLTDAQAREVVERLPSLHGPPNLRARVHQADDCCRAGRHPSRAHLCKRKLGFGRPLRHTATDHDSADDALARSGRRRHWARGSWVGQCPFLPVCARRACFSNAYGPLHPDAVRRPGPRAMGRQTQRARAFQALLQVGTTTAHSRLRVRRAHACLPVDRLIVVRPARLKGGKSPQHLQRRWLSSARTSAARSRLVRPASHSGLHRRDNPA